MKYSNLEVPPSGEISLLSRRGDLFGLVNTRELHASVDAYLEPSRGMPASDVSARVSYPGLVLLSHQPQGGSPAVRNGISP